jgi:hypothetical protein
MCTVTLVPYINAGCPHGGKCVRVACNRDEQRLRPAALPPCIHSVGEREAIFPLDPVSDGTWIAINDAGLAFVLLNLNGSNHPAHSSPLSRGAIILSLLHSGTLTAALGPMSTLDTTLFAPFRLLVLDRFALAEVISDGQQTDLVQCVRISKPFLFTSSGLGDQLVEGPRRELFDASFGQCEDWLDDQDRFHRHRWPECPQLSVCMSRAEARTVSYSVADITPEGSTLTYHPDAPDLAVEPIRVVLRDQLGGAA